MADDQKTGSPQEEAIISRLRETPGQSPTAVTTYVGLLGRSPKQGYWLLYLSLDMTQWIEINESDIVHSEQLPPDRSPFGSLGGTQVFVKANANVITSKTASVAHAANEPPDDFDLDVQLGGSASTPSLLPQTIVTPQAAAVVGAVATCNTCHSCVTCVGTCKTCVNTCHTACGTCVTCATCQTHCNQATCANTQCNQATCVQTQCNQQTCATCQTQCGQATCAQTQCNQATCHTCLTQCNQHTCANTCKTCVTCPTCHTCDTCHPPGHFCQ